MKKDQVALKRIIKHLYKLERPAYVGELSLAIGYSLERTEGFLQHLIEQGYVRYATEEELPKAGAFVVTLIDKANVGWAFE